MCDNEGRSVGVLLGRVVCDNDGRSVGAVLGRVVCDNDGRSVGVFLDGCCVTMTGVRSVLCSGVYCSISERGVLELPGRSSGDGPDAGTAPPSRHI